MPPEICPNCGAEVPRNARACPECGSDETTGWSDEAEAGHLGLPDDSFNYEEFGEREFGGERARPRGVSKFWWVVAVLVLLAFAWLMLSL
ncbi:MAG TPA: zinc ribbon domain-containing protein [Verrucomicrobia bacterium]|nr:zinc ribbon domain-containing protein [Verrucomicrobiota bacterium]HPU55801.1 zinc ribbon domain-containing protein [Verrucomicrobiota bacterium]